MIAITIRRKEASRRSGSLSASARFKSSSIVELTALPLLASCRLVLAKDAASCFAVEAEIAPSRSANPAFANTVLGR